MNTLSPITLHRLDVQGFDNVDAKELAQVAPWLRLAFAVCALLAGAGTAAASPSILFSLVPIALLAALMPVHPVDLLYNHAIRFVTGTGKLPRRGIPARASCGLGAAWLIATALAFASGHTTAAYYLGTALTGVATLVSTTDICIPSMIFRVVFGQPTARGAQALKTVAAT